MEWIDLNYHYAGMPTDEHLDASFADARQSTLAYEDTKGQQYTFAIIFTVAVSEEPSRQEFKALEGRIKARLQALATKDSRFNLNNFVVTTSYNRVPELALV
jgi:hypothetical protein